jgi:hypothetical protein
VSEPGTSEAHLTPESRYNLRSRNIRSEERADEQPQTDNVADEEIARYDVRERE